MYLLRERRPPSRAGRAAAALLLGVATFQALLAGGAPWGRAAYGGARTGVLPNSLRVSSAIAAVLYAVLAAAIGTRIAPDVIRGRITSGTSALMIVGSIMNAASPSVVERIIWTPVAALLVITLRRAVHVDGVGAGHT